MGAVLLARASTRGPGSAGQATLQKIDITNVVYPLRIEN
jgi:hypothetical protein